MFYDTGSSSMDQIQSNDQPVWDMLPRRCSAMTFGRDMEEPLPKRAYQRERYAAVRFRGGTTPGRTGELTPK